MTDDRAARTPPGQYLTEDFPVLHAGRVQHVDTSSWSLRLTGLVAPDVQLDYSGLSALPAVEEVVDIHCVTRWSKLDTRWKGVRFRDLLAASHVEVGPGAAHVLIKAEADWTTNLPLAEMLADDVLVAYEYEGKPLSVDHGGPVRLLVPRLYLWKSAKWLREIEFTADQRQGYWERLGYHALGDPWLEQRYA